MVLKEKLQIIGGAKTGYNLYNFFVKKGIDASLYYFSNEYASKKNVGQLYNSSKEILLSDPIIITSETAFNHIIQKSSNIFGVQYYLRNKDNIPEISKEIDSSFIPELTGANLSFPLAVKPRESMAGKVPFKFKKIESAEELHMIEQVLADCILQPFFGEKEFIQVAVAGYFNGYSHSLIAVEQKNHYPKGISAYVVDKSAENKALIKNIEDYLKKIKYRGFIEFEFKQNIESGTSFLMDINPRPWGWFYYYLNGIENVKEVFLEDKPVQLNLKKAWVNTPRLGMAMVKGDFNHPKLKDVFGNRICYEPYFK